MSSAKAPSLLPYRSTNAAWSSTARTRPAFAVNQIMKDLDIIGEVSQHDHCPMPLVAQIRRQYEAAFVNGCGDLDFFVLARESARVAGL
jgi:3-hydroxyisobutyrate dehydrogenase-like beta-hydroxyacid dehydrogenase